LAGWIKLNREITKHWIWQEEAFTKAQAWVDLLLWTNHAPTKKLIKGQLIHVDRGQQLRSEVTLAEQWKWSRGKVRRFLKALENESMIVQRTNNVTSIITISNYNDYQDAEKGTGTPNGTPDNTPSGTGTGQQTDIGQYTVNNDKNGDNGNKGKKKSITPKTTLDFSAWPQMPTDQIFDDWKKMRKAKKAALSQTVVDGIGEQLAKLTSKGISVDQSLTIACVQGWAGFKADWVINNLRQNQSNGKKTGQSLADANDAAIRDYGSGGSGGNTYDQDEYAEFEQLEQSKGQSND